MIIVDTMNSDLKREFINVLKKSLVDFKKYLSQLDVEKTFENKGVL